MCKLGLSLCKHVNITGIQMEMAHELPHTRQLIVTCEISDTVPFHPYTQHEATLIFLSFVYVAIDIIYDQFLAMGTIFVWN